MDRDLPVLQIFFEPGGIRSLHRSRSTWYHDFFNTIISNSTTGVDIIPLCTIDLNPLGKIVDIIPLGP